MTNGILIRCDASADVGLGHLMRCLALADALRDEGVRVEFAMNAPSDLARSYLAQTGHKLHTLDSAGASNIVALMRERDLATVLVDHYDASGDDFAALADSANLVCAIDDQANRDFSRAAWVLNPNPCISASEYHVSPDAELLIGPRYALLRSEFAALRADVDSSCGAKILVQFGGGDTGEWCERTVRWLQSIDGKLEIRCIMVGGSESKDRSIQEGHHDLSILRDVACIAKHMRWADFSIGAAGSSCWEFCCLGVPMVIGELSDDQSRIATELDRRGAAIHIGQWNQIERACFLDAVRRLLADRQLRKRMSIAGMELVDGLGVVRAARSLIKRMKRCSKVAL